MASLRVKKEGKNNTDFAQNTFKKSKELGKIFCLFHSILPYLQLLKNNREYRLYLCSHLCQHAGDWFVHVASLITIERLLPGNAKAISLMVATKMLPNMLLSPLGGMIADNCDRKRLMITLDLLASVLVLGYIIALAFNSPLILFTVSFLRACITACYEPVTKSMVPMLVTNEEDLKRATTLHTAAWSGMLMLGGFVAGISASILGVEICYMIDSITYMISAYIMYKVPGIYRAVSKNSSSSSSMKTLLMETSHNPQTKNKIKFLIEETVKNWKESFQRNIWELHYYIKTCGFGMLILFKASGALIWGTADVLNASIAHVEGDEALTSQRLGMIYSSVGLGCLTGPLVANTFTNMKQLKTLQTACILALVFMTVGWMGLAACVNSHFSDDYYIKVICFFVFVRTIGSAIIWMNSTLLLQKLMRNDHNIMGRVLSLEFSFAMGSEMFAAFVAGFLHDDLNLSKDKVALAAALIGIVLLLSWSIFHVRGGGAARKEFNYETNTNQSQDMDIMATDLLAKSHENHTIII